MTTVFRGVVDAVELAAGAMLGAMLGVLLARLALRTRRVRRWLGVD